MQTRDPIGAPRRITDLVQAARAGHTVSLETTFDIRPVDFHYLEHPFEAYIFLALYDGAVDGQLFSFRKCYARGCPHNLCTHVSQAIIIANRYLERDCAALSGAGISTGDKKFSLQDMLVKFDRRDAPESPVLTIPEMIRRAEIETGVTIEIDLEYMPAVEHFAGRKTAQTFLSGEFKAPISGVICHCHRCFACYSTGRAETEAPGAVALADARLGGVYQAFDEAGIRYRKKLFADISFC